MSVKIAATSQHKLKENERNLCQNLLTIKNTDSDLKAHALDYANDLSYSKTLQNSPNSQTEAITNYQKQVLVMIKHCLGNS